MYRFKLKLLYLFCCLLVCSGLAAQDASYFVYIQHEKQQPFYVKLEGKMLSSSVKGYVILPKLPQGKVPVTIGFPKSEAPEQSYVIRLTGQRDYGFLLKNTGEKEYALYDLQTFATLKSGGGAAAAPLQENVTVTRISSEGSTAEQKELMNNVQADVETALAAKKPDTLAPKKKGSFAEALDRVVTDDRPEDMPLEAPKPKPVVVAAPIEADVVPAAEAPPVKKPRGKKNRKEREALSEEEQNLLSSVMEDEKKAAADEAVATAVPAMVDSVSATMSDTVSGGEEVPVAKKERKPKKKKEQAEPEFIDFNSTAKPAAAAPVVEKVVPEEETAVQPEISAKDAREAKREKRKAEREAAERAAFVKDSIANAEFNTSTPVAEAPVEEKKSSIKMVNSDCEKILEVDAFRKLLRTMNSKKSDDDMVDAFRKGTRSVCISTEQIRALTQLISTEESRYQLLDAAYARTYDTQNFSTLADLLKEDYYKGRFKAMIKK
ncbi:DUF4476 domain-containing protein [Chitinophaga sp. SYP-B3965]|uniref:DUF4476 domain-containing protein n=1 Tax=Chitinophaga sp. SYP-B3965 TaxID=2663120 RepID=UPI001299D478|nr:DUF4476 domain-containing protein [Chitinophaga sp. SYP-B3965]MRG49164.1 DUF4476 domain-containing protein [Chitinophaga sp. SYP-B3965]